MTMMHTPSEEDSLALEAADAAHAETVRLDFLTEASENLLAALHADEVRDPGDADTERLCAMRVHHCREALHEMLVHIKDSRGKARS